MPNHFKSVLIFTGFYLILSTSVFAQNQYANWYFGDKAGLNFSSGAVNVLTNSAMSNLEGVSALSDTTGNLLLYSDGQILYNAQHNAMPNGSGLKGHSSATQGSVLVQKPGSDKIFYLISTGAVEQGTIDVYYSEIDITLDGGKGDVVSGKKNLLMYSGSAEKCAAAYHCNGTSIWLVFHDYQGSNYRSYLLDENGISTSAVVTSIGTNHSVSRHRSGQMKFNPDGTRLANCLRGDALNETSVDLLDFDKSSGKFINFRAKLITNDLSYGVEFSPSGDLLYTASGTASPPAGSGKLHQFNLNAGSANQTDIQNSRVLLSSHSNIWYGALQVALNGKIYMTALNQTSLGVINSPNTVGTSCNFNMTGQSLNSRKGFLGLPNFVSAVESINRAFLGPDTALCENESVSYDVSHSGASYRWNDNTTSPTKNFTQAGTYFVSVTKNGCTQSDTVVVSKLSISNSNTLGSDTSICNGDSIILVAPVPNAQYTWHDNSSGSSFIVKTAGVYWVKMELNGCSVADTIVVQEWPKVTVNLGTDTALCEGMTLTLDVASSNSTYRWQDNSTNSSYTVVQSGTYWVEKTTNGCKGSDTINITYSDPPPHPNLGSDKELCEGASFKLQANAPAGVNFVWYNNSNSSSITIRETGKYWITYTNSCGITSDTLNANFIKCFTDIYVPLAFTPNGDDLNDFFGPILPNIGDDEYDFCVFNRWGEIIFISSPEKPKWDGIYDGQRVPLGAYGWLLDINSPILKKTTSGTVTVLY